MEDLADRVGGGDGVQSKGIGETLDDWPRGLVVAAEPDYSEFVRTGKEQSGETHDAPTERDMRAARPFARSLELDARLRHVVPGGAHTYAKGIDQFPEGCAPDHRARVGLPRLGRRRERVHRISAWACRPSSSGTATRPSSTRSPHSSPRGTNFVRPSPLELDAAETFLGLRHPGRHGEVHEGRIDGKHRRSQACARLHRSRFRRALRRSPVLLVRRLGDRRDARPRRHPGERRGTDLDLPLRRPTSVEELLSRHPGEIACFILEPERASPPSEGYLQRLHELVAAVGALLVLDGGSVERVSVAHRGARRRSTTSRPIFRRGGRGIANGFAL